MSTFSASLDPYQFKDSPLHRLDARVKIPLTLAYILLTSLLPSAAWLAYLLLLLINLALALLSTLGIPFVLKRALLALPFMLAAVPLLFTGPDPRIKLLTGNNWAVLISQPGLIRFISIAIKSWLSLQAAILLAATTPFSTIAVALRSLHFPKLLVSIVSLMWRYLFLMLDQAGRLLRARSARSGALPPRPGLHPGGKLRWRARVTGGMAGNLFLRSLERSDRVYAAMLSRGYDGEQRAMPAPNLSRQDGMIILVGFLFLAMVAVIGLLTGG